MKRIILNVCCLIILSIFLSSCKKQNKKIIIYSCAEDYRNEFYLNALKEKFAQYDFSLEYMTSGSAAAKLKFVIENPENNNNTLLEFTVPEELGKWKEYTSTFTPTKDLDWCHIYIVNYTTVNEGNDFAIDNIYFGTVQNTEATEFLETFTVDISTNPPTVTSTMEKL